jgi:2-dehydro-3-deoxygluconokinase
MKKIVTFGEIMLRLSTPGHQRFIQAEMFSACYGGGEANVAVSLANFGLDCQFVTKLPDHDVGQAALNHLRRYGVGVDHIVLGEGRLGLYFLETGASMRASQVIYDRDRSCIAEATAEDFDFEKIFSGVDWFHFTGITPALSDGAAQCVETALQAAKKQNVTISVDLNYRKKLWTTDKARKVMSSLMPYVDVCIGNEEDAEKVLGFSVEGTDVSTAKLNLQGYRKMLQRMQEAYSFKHVVTTLRDSLSASDNRWSALLYDGKSYYQSKSYDIHVVDRVGGGDSFAGGLIYALSSGYSPQDALEFAVAASALKHTIPGDFNLVSIEEVERLAGGDSSGRVQR